MARLSAGYEKLTTNGSRALHDFFNITNILNPGGTFADAIGLAPHRLSPSSFEFPRLGRMSFRYKVPRSEFPLSAWLAVIDEVTTMALVANDDASVKSRRAGVSVSLYAERVETGGVDATRKGDVVRIDVGVTKIGRLLGFADAEITDPKTEKVICFGRHTKYLPGGIVTDFVLRKNVMPWMSWILSFFAGFSPPSPSSTQATTESLDELMRFCDVSEDGSSSTFVGGKPHFNFYQTLHGGCQAIMMETMASRYLSKRSRSPLQRRHQLRSVQIDYISSARKSVDVRVDALSEDRRSGGGITTGVTISRSSSTTAVSRGVLRWEESDDIRT